VEFKDEVFKNYLQPKPDRTRSQYGLMVPHQYLEIVGLVSALQVNRDGEPMRASKYQFEILPHRLHLHLPDTRLLKRHNPAGPFNTSDGLNRLGIPSPPPFPPSNTSISHHAACLTQFRPPNWSPTTYIYLVMISGYFYLYLVSKDFVVVIK
jgi:hypothetical protein